MKLWENVIEQILRKYIAANIKVQVFLSSPQGLAVFQRSLSSFYDFKDGVSNVIRF